MHLQLTLSLLSIAVAAISIEPPPIFNEWVPFTTELPQPPIIDMREGGKLEMYMAETKHDWGSGGPSGQVYGYGIVGKDVSYPGPTILATRNRAIRASWTNSLGNGTHLLQRNVESSLLTHQSACYPNCGIPLAVHVHGLENPPQFDGLPDQTIYKDHTFHATYSNRGASATKIYHDHAVGLTRLNAWAGLVGTYILSDPQLEKRFGLDNIPDLIFTLQEKTVSVDGALIYTPSVPCASEKATNWFTRPLGSVNTVNGVVMPYSSIEQGPVRMRWINVANARTYNLSSSFFQSCDLIATDGGFVQRPKRYQANQTLTLQPFERVEIVCDFSRVEIGTTFVVMDDTSPPNPMVDYRVLQIRVTSRKDRMMPPKVDLPKTLIKYKDLQALHQSTGGLTRTIDMGNPFDKNSCLVEMNLAVNNQVLDINHIKGSLHCTRGKVEKWQFTNGIPVTHPFHWHLVHAQCGPDENSIDKNGLKDVQPIPGATGNTITQVCYVACTPAEFLFEDSDRGPKDFGFQTDDPYLAHCHILEHEENIMMAWFHITDKDVPN